MSIKRPEVVIMAGPNGSGKSTYTEQIGIIKPYINADDLKRTTHCTDKEAAEKSDELRRQAIKQGIDFSFETVLSSRYKFELLKELYKNNYFIRCYYFLTKDPNINLVRVNARVAQGGHDVPPDRIKSRYDKCLHLLPQIIQMCDVCNIYDNTVELDRIFKKRKDEYFRWKNEYWSLSDIENLTKITQYTSYRKVNGHI